MKGKFLFAAATIVALTFSSCSKDDTEPQQPGETTEAYINASSSTIWQYYSFAKNEVVGSAEGNAENDADWAARKDWDIAIRRMYIRTNSGTSTSVGSQGGVFIFDTDNKDNYGNITATTSFASVKNVSDVSALVSDVLVTYAGMSGDITTSQSKAVVTAMKKEESGAVMPPVYLKAPVCLFRTADGNNYYKVEFTQYQDEDANRGHVKFNKAQIYKK